ANRSEYALLLMALLSSLIGHLIDTGFSFQVAPTAILFWSCLGLSLAMIRSVVAAPELVKPASGPVPTAGRSTPTASPSKRPLPSKSKDTRSQARDTFVFLGIMTVLVVLPLLSGFLHVLSHRDLSFGDVLEYSLTRLDGRTGRTALTVLLLGASW